jgi:threonyl-tRNA synthetase
MQKTIKILEAFITIYTEKMKRLSEEELCARPSADKWSKKEIIGHLIDSAQNNIRRFIVARYENRPHIVYQQDNWVAMQNYQHYPSEELITLWKLINKHICIVLTNISEKDYNRLCNTGKETEELHKLEFLVSDYVEHQLHHLQQIA